MHVYRVHNINSPFTVSRKVLKKISVGEIKPDETIEAVREAALLAQVSHAVISLIYLIT